MKRTSVECQGKETVEKYLKNKRVYLIAAGNQETTPECELHGVLKVDPM